MRLGETEASGKGVDFTSLPQMPVLLMATMTSPSLRFSPFSRVSTDGSASATQRSCLGFVYTPMFFLAGFSAVAVVVVVVADILYVQTYAGLSENFNEEGQGLNNACSSLCLQSLEGP